MAKFKAYYYRQRVFLPVSLEGQLMPATLEFAIHTLLETRLDTSGFGQQNRNDETGAHRLRSQDPFNDRFGGGPSLQIKEYTVLGDIRFYRSSCPVNF